MHEHRVSNPHRRRGPCGTRYGGHSATRTLTGIAFEGSSYAETFFLADLKIDWAKPAHQGNLFLDKGRIAAIIPFKSGCVRAIGILPSAFHTHKTITLEEFSVHDKNHV